LTSLSWSTALVLLRAPVRATVDTVPSTPIATSTSGAP
jgi:hypothetical protein